MAEGSFYFQKLFIRCDLQHKGVFGQFNLILLRQMGYPKPGIP